MVRNIYFIAFNRYLIWKNTTNYSKSQQTTEAEAGHFLYFDCNKFLTQMDSLPLINLNQMSMDQTHLLSISPLISNLGFDMVVYSIFYFFKLCHRGRVTTTACAITVGQ